MYSLGTVHAHYLPFKLNTSLQKDLSFQASGPDPGNIFFLSRLDFKQDFPALS